MTVTLADIEAAARTIAGHVERTPCRKVRTLSQIAGADLYLKFENLQFTASFKERGALNKLTSLTDDERARGVIAMSAGNHAQGVAYHAKRLGIPAVIVMPEGTPFTKIKRTEDYGAEVIVRGESLSESADFAAQLCDERSLVFVHPYDDEKIIAGQGTIALEMLADYPEIDTLVVPIGGGGIISGNAIAAKALKPDIKVIGAETILYPSMRAILRGETYELGGNTIADGIAVKRPGVITREIVRELVDDLLVVEEEYIEHAVGLLLDVEKSVVEGAGATGLAAVLANREMFAGRKVGLILCGGNIDMRLLSSVIMRELARLGRVVQFRFDVADMPGLLGRIATAIGDAGGNIVEVKHDRLYTGLPARVAELHLLVEARDAAHVDEIVAALNQAGLSPAILHGPDPRFAER